MIVNTYIIQYLCFFFSFNTFFDAIFSYVYVTHAIVFQSINCHHLKKGLYSKRRESNKFILRAVSHIDLLRCRLIYNQHYAPYEHIYIYM